MSKDDNGSFDGLVLGTNRLSEPEIAKDLSDLTPGTLTMELPSVPSMEQIPTLVERCEVFTLSGLDSVDSSQMSFIAIVIGVAGDRAFFCPMDPDRADQCAEKLKLAAAEMRRRSPTKGTVN